jgi:hypothetical protein
LLIRISLKIEKRVYIKPKIREARCINQFNQLSNKSKLNIIENLFNGKDKGISASIGAL